MTIKAERVAELILNHLSQIFLMEARDPRLQGLTITDVQLDRELEHAQIYVNALGEDDRADDVIEALEHAQGYLRSELASRLRLRRMPLLHFHWDFSLARAMQMEELLDSIKENESLGSAGSDKQVDQGGKDEELHD
ncbi:MAG: 30S ribosome-binding factor RbfA [Chloroflexi bacterium]|jgi:ribosome-binding factor A|nr:30S ribosome-binding factor RbfA [Chloroflexota bacterium]